MAPQPQAPSSGSSHSSEGSASSQHTWSFEEQFKQVRQVGRFYTLVCKKSWHVHMKMVYYHNLWLLLLMDWKRAIVIKAF